MPVIQVAVELSINVSAVFLTGIYLLRIASSRPQETFGIAESVDIHNNLQAGSYMRRQKMGR